MCGRINAIVAGVIAMFALLPGRGSADVLEAANTVRTAGCNGKAGRPPLQRDPRLDKAAKSLTRGVSLHDAAGGAGYHATALASIHLGGYQRDEELRGLLSRQYCETLMKAELRGLGSAKRGTEIWLVLGAELKIPQDAQSTSRRVLELINQARARPRRCGSQSFAAAGTLTLDAKLGAAAQAHATDMARHAYFEHEGRDGSTPALRVSAAGYVWRHVGENIAAGPGSAEEVVKGWLESPGHCANIMSAKFTEMGVAYAQSRDDYGIYWTQVFATPR